MLKPEYQDHFKNVLLHSIRADEDLRELSIASKLDTDWEFLTSLRDKGRKTMAQWLDQHFDDIGVNMTVDLQDEFLG
jgi:NTE family protein